MNIETLWNKNQKKCAHGTRLIDRRYEKLKQTTREPYIKEVPPVPAYI